MDDEEELFCLTAVLRRLYVKRKSNMGRGRGIQHAGEGQKVIFNAGQLGSLLCDTSVQIRLRSLTQSLRSLHSVDIWCWDWHYFNFVFIGENLFSD